MNLLLSFLLFPLGSSLATYATLFFMLLLSGVGLPIPEEVTLILAGYLAYLEFVNFFVVIVVLVAGILAADVLGYTLGKKAGDWLWANIFGKVKFAHRLMQKAEYYFRRHGEKVVIFSRPLAGMRLVVPMLAGHFKMDFKKFMLYDIAGAVPWAILLPTVSYYLGTGLELLVKVRQVRHEIFLLIVGAALLWAIVKIISSLVWFGKE